MGKVIPLRGLIYSKFESESECACAMGWKKQRLNKITTGKKEPDLNDVKAISDVLGVTFMDVANIFLREKSPNGEK